MTRVRREELAWVLVALVGSLALVVYPFATTAVVVVLLVAGAAMVNLRLAVQALPALWLLLPTISTYWDIRLGGFSLISGIKEVAAVALLLCVAAWLALEPRSRLRLDAPILALSLFIGLYLAKVFTSSDTGVALLTVRDMAGASLLYLLLRWSPLSRSEIRSAILLAIVVLAGIAVLGLLQYAQGWGLTYAMSETVRRVNFFGGPEEVVATNTVAALLAQAIALLLPLALAHRVPAAWALTAVLWAGVFVSFSRRALAALLLVHAVFLLRFGTPVRRALGMAGFGLVLVIAYWSVAADVQARFVGDIVAGEDYSLNYRFMEYAFVLSSLERTDWLFGLDLTLFGNSAERTGSGTALDSGWLTLFAHLGVTGLLLVSMLSWKAVRVLFRADPRSEPYTIGAALAVGVFLLVNLSGDSFPGAVLFWSALAYLHETPDEASAEPVGADWVEADAAAATA